MFAPWLFLPLLFLLPFVSAAGPVLVVALALAAAGLRGPPRTGAGAGPAPAAAGRLGAGAGGVLERVLGNPSARSPTPSADLDADVVGLVEVTRRQARTWARIRPARPLPDRAAGPEANRGLLSRYPLLDSGVRQDGSARQGSGLLWARLDLGGGRQLTVVVAHPLPAAGVAVLVAAAALGRTAARRRDRVRDGASVDARSRPDDGCC